MLFASLDEIKMMAEAKVCLAGWDCGKARIVVEMNVVGDMVVPGVVQFMMFRCLDSVNALITVEMEN
ncbi:hypothetical protein LINGRAHAP2_LOCUS35900 [Linum grandiflorum]